MTQRVIDVDGVPTLFSPVLAHALEPGDLFTLPHPGTTDGQPLGWFTGKVSTRRVLAVVERTGTEIILRRTCPKDGSKVVGYALNRPVLRAVGARAGRVGTQ